MRDIHLCQREDFQHAWPYGQLLTDLSLQVSSSGTCGCKLANSDIWDALQIDSDVRSHISA